MARKDTWRVAACGMFMVLGLLGSWVTEAPAELITVDSQYHDPYTGVPGVVLDTTTGKEWLRMWCQGTDYGPQAYAQFLWDLSPQGRYAGWQLASSDDVFTLMADAGLPTHVTYVDTFGQYATATHNFQQLIGSYYDGSEGYWTTALVSDPAGPGYVNYIDLGTRDKWVLKPGADSRDPSNYFHTYDSYFYDVQRLPIQVYNDMWWSGSYAIFGWLERDSAPVPEPSAVFLFGVGIIGMVYARKKMSNNP